MVDLPNLFTQIITPFTGGSPLKLPESPFKASAEELNFTNYQTLNNDDDDEYVIDAQQKTMQDLVEKAKNDIKAGTDKEDIAGDLYEGLLGLEGTNGQKYNITSKEFLQNFNALVSQVKDDPTLVNELRKRLVTEFGKLADEQLVPDARKEWYEISYENSLDKLKTQNATISSELESLSKLDPTKSEDKKKIDSFITSIKKDFGDIAKFNELLKDANIKYKIDSNEKDGYSIKSTDPNTTAIDPKSIKAIQMETLNDWEKNAEFINNLDTGKFKTADGNKDARIKIKELAEGNKPYTKGELKENLDFLTEAYKYNLDTGEFSKADLDRARMNLIDKIHQAEKPAIEEYRRKYTGKTDKPHYESEFSDGISKLNTIAFLQNRDLRENAIIPRLEKAAEANGYSDIKSATGGENSALAELIDKSCNWEPKEPEAPEEFSNIELNQLSSAAYSPDQDTISFSDGSLNAGDIGLGEFLQGLLADEIKLTDSNGKIIKIENAKDKVTLTRDDDKKEIEIEIDNGSGSEQKIVFGIPLDQLTDEFVKNYTMYNTVDELLKNYKDKQ